MDTDQPITIDFRTSRPFRGDVDKAMTFVVSALTPLGFQVTRTTADSVELAAPALTRTRQSALVGASRLRVACRGGEAVAEAELGGVRRLSRFLLILPLCVCLILGIVFAGISVAFDHAGWWIPAAIALGVNLVVWLIMGPLLARWLRAKTIRGIDLLLTNMIAIGGR